MRNTLLIAAACLTPLAAGQASAETYASISGGAALLSDSDLEDGGVEAEAEFDIGFAVNGALGYVWNRLAVGTLRTELEVGYRLNDVDEISAFGVTASAGDAEVSAFSGMINAALDFDTGSFIQPYGMVGIGIANVSLESDDLDVDEDDTVFAFQAGAGLNLPITDTVILFGGYRFFGTADPEFDGVEAEYNSHNLEAGVRVSF